MLKKISIIADIILLIAFLAGSVWFIGNLIAYNNRWKGLSPALRSEWENTGEKDENPIVVFVKRGLGMSLPQGLDQFREPGVTILNLQDAVRKLETNQRLLEAEVDAIRAELMERDKTAT